MRPVLVIAALLAFSGAAKPQAVPTYSSHVRRILESHCTGCHVRGGIGRLALDTYDQARAFVREILNTANNRQMPPVYAVPGFGQFYNEQPLSVSDIETLDRWSAAGMPRGDEEPPAKSVIASQKWRLGPPAFTVTARSTIQANGRAYDSRCFFFPAGFAEPKGVKFIDVKPGNRQAVYLVRAFAVAAKAKNAADCSQVSGSKTRVLLGEWAPHVAPDLLPEGVGRVLPAGWSVVVEITYQKIGIAVNDQTQVGLYFRPATKPLRAVAIQNAEFTVPANNWDYRVNAEWSVDRDVTVFSIAPYMRRLGMDMRVVAKDPSGAADTLLWVRDYDPYRRQTYLLKTPRRLAKGTRIQVEAIFNNSESNVRLPRAELQPVRAGASEVEEAAIAFLEFTD